MTAAATATAAVATAATATATTTTMKQTSSSPTWGRVFIRLKILLFTRKKGSSIKQTDVREMPKKVSKSVCTATILVSPDPLSPTLSNSSAMKTPENKEGEPDDPEPENEGDIKREYFSD